jgi:putative ATPase
MKSNDKESTLFSGAEQAKLDAAAPLAVRIRPVNLDEFLGQEHFLGKGKLLRRMLEADRLSSLIFYGPPGSGKTSLAMVIANYTRAKFHYLSAPAATVKDIREVIASAKDRLLTDGAKTVFSSMRFIASTGPSRTFCWTTLSRAL